MGAETPTRGPSKRAALGLAAILLLVAVVLAVAYALVGERTLTAMHEGRSWPFLNELIQRTGNRPLPVYLIKGRLLCSRAVIVLTGAALLLCAYAFRGPLARHMRAVVLQPEAALNLGAVRIAVFAALLVQLTVTATPQRLALYAALPRSFVAAPIFCGPMAFVTQLDGTTLEVLWWVLVVATTCSMLGLFSRTMAVTATLLALLVLSLPQFYGKVQHYHHLLWFAAVLAASPCGAALSLDRLLTRRPPGLPSVAYGLPLHCIQILMGLVYFFPGFWKIWELGIDWMLSDNLANLMHAKWYELGGFDPIFRVDRYPLLCALGALGAVVFEMGFLVLVFVPRLRWLLIPIGLGFHNSTNLLMGIPFWELQLCYVAFVPWDWLFRRGPRPAVEPGNWREAWPAALVGGMLILGTIFCGVRMLERAWPVACYPTFAYREGPDIDTVHLEIARPGGGWEDYNQGPPRSALRSDRWASLLGRLSRTEDPVERQRRCRLLWEYLQAQGLAPAGDQAVRVVKIVALADPDVEPTVISREVLTQWQADDPR